MDADPGSVFRFATPRVQMAQADAEGSPATTRGVTGRRARVRVGDGPRHGLPERSTASLRAVLRESMTRPGKDRAGEVSSPLVHRRSRRFERVADAVASRP